MAGLASLVGVIGRPIAEMDTWDVEILPGGGRRFIKPDRRKLAEEAADRVESERWSAEYNAKCSGAQ
jgi:hypothetical protein